MVLLIGFGLVLRTLVQLMELSPGYDGRRVLTASLPLQDARYASASNCACICAITPDNWFSVC